MVDPPMETVSWPAEVRVQIWLFPPLQSQIRN